MFEATGGGDLGAAARTSVRETDANMAVVTCTRTRQEDMTS